MMNHHFISYSRADAKDFALKLCDKLIAGPPSVKIWLDVREMNPGTDWADQLVNAIRRAESLIFVMSRDSVESQSGCKDEWSRALKYKKPIIPILIHEDAEIPFRLENRQYIDFTGEFSTGLAKLRDHIQWLNSPLGKLQAMNDRLDDARRELRRTDETNRQKRIQEDIDSLEAQISIQEKIVANPVKAAETAEENIERGLGLDRQPEKQSESGTRARFINSPPGSAPAYFQDRFIETKMVADFLKNDSERLLTIAGRGGVGKTAMVCRLLKSLESGYLPNDEEELKVDAIVYLSESGSRKVSFINLYFDLCQLLPEKEAKKFEGIYKDANASSGEKTFALLSAFPRGLVVILMDNFEDKINLDTREITDAELDEALKAILRFEQHALKVIITTRMAPRSLTLVEPGRQRRLDLDEGLKHPYAENILQELDVDGKLGLREVSNELLKEARLRTNGFPRALEALFAILSADRHTTLQEILTDAKQQLPEHVMEMLVGEAFSRLDDSAQTVMKALAIYGRPVRNSAVDFLLQPHLPGIESAPVLDRLVNMRFVRKEASRYYLHPTDREYVISLIPRGQESEKAEEAFTQFSLLYRGADYFKLARLPRQDWKNIGDLAAQLAEFELRFACEDYNTAARVLSEIDYDFLQLWGHYRLLVQYHERLQRHLLDQQLKKRSASILGMTYWYMGRYQQAITSHEQALEIARETGNRGSEGTCLGNIGTCYSFIGEIPRAIEFYEQALQIAREIGNHDSMGVWLHNLGNCYRDLGEMKRAIDYYEKTQKTEREASDRAGEGLLLGNLGTYYRDLGETPHAIQHHQKALEIAREINNRRGEGFWLGSLGHSYHVLGETQRSIEYFEQALNIAREIGDRKNEGLWLCELCSLYGASDQTQRAMDYHDKSASIGEDIGSLFIQVTNLTYIGQLFLDQDRYNETTEKLNHAVRLADEMGYMRFRNLSRYYLSLALFYTGDSQGANEVLEEARKCNYLPNNHNLTVLENGSLS